MRYFFTFIFLLNSIGICYLPKVYSHPSCFDEKDFSGQEQFRDDETLTHTNNKDLSTRESSKKNQNDSSNELKNKNINQNVKEKENDQDSKNSQEEEKKKDEKTPKSPHTFKANVSFVSDYRFRGISQTMRQPAVQGGFDYAHESGFYLGTWASNVDGTTHFYNNTSMEWDFYGGYKGKPFACSLPDLIYNVGVLYYYYPGGKASVSSYVPYNTAEWYIELAYKWLSVKYWQSFTNYFGVESDNPPFNWEKNRPDRPNGSSKGSSYIEANATFDLLDQVCFRNFQGGKLNLLVHIGHVTVRHYEHLSYTDWRATLTQEFVWFNLFATYIGTNAKKAYFNVPDNSYHPKKRHLGVQGFVIGVLKTF
jgi:uncharacterized protein (TIGR02001 family)